MDKEDRKKIRTHQDLNVYQNLYEAMLLIMREIVPSLPPEEKYDLASQMRRGSKSPPALLAEGFAKRYQKKHWSRYLNDVLGEIYEMQTHLDICIDVYGKYVDIEKCLEVKELYRISGAQTYKLLQTWKSYHENTGAS